MTNLNKFSLMIFAMLQVACAGGEASFSADAMLKMGSEKVKESCVNYTQYDLYPRYIDHGEREWTLVPVTDWTTLKVQWESRSLQAFHVSHEFCWPS